MSDTLHVFVRGLKLEAEIGLYAHEQGRSQPLLVDITVELAPTTITRIGETLDYDKLAGAARRLAAEGHIGLVETFAQQLAAACLDHPRVLAVVVRVEKPQAIPGGAVAGVEVRLERG